MCSKYYHTDTIVMSAPPHSTLREFFGRVIEIAPKYKAIVQFQLDNNFERALLWYDKLKVNGQALPEGGSIDEYLEKDSCLKFLCHSFDDRGVDRCRWYITCAWRQEARDLDLCSNETILKGMYNQTGHIVEVARRQGILSFTINGQEENVLFLGSKLFLSGKRVPAKASLNQLAGLEEGRALGFDAVPCDPTDDGRCCWFATVVWKGRKPDMDYDFARPLGKSSPPQITEIKMAISNPHSLFVRGEGHMLQILNPEYGLALVAIKNNRWESVLFHRSFVTLFDHCLAKEDLTKIFEEGDKIRLIAAAAPKKMGVRWVASQVRVLIDHSVSHRFQF